MHVEGHLLKVTYALIMLGMTQTSCSSSSDSKVPDAGIAIPDASDDAQAVVDADDGRDAGAGDANGSTTEEAGTDVCTLDTPAHMPRDCSAQTASLSCRDLSAKTGPGIASCGPAGSGASGQEQYCCTLSSTGSSCHADSSVSCQGTAKGYACSGADNPSQVKGASVLCKRQDDAPSGGTYCCEPFTSTTSCKVYYDLGSCGHAQYGFSCEGSDRPTNVLPSLNCGDGQMSPINDDILFCCQYAPGR